MTKEDAKAISRLLDKLYSLTENLPESKIRSELEETISRLENLIVGARSQQILDHIEKLTRP